MVYALILGEVNKDAIEAQEASIIIGMRLLLTLVNFPRRSLLVAIISGRVRVSTQEPPSHLHHPYWLRWLAFRGN